MQNRQLVRCKSANLENLHKRAGVCHHMAKWQEAPGEGPGGGGDKALEGAQPLHGAQAIRLGSLHRNRPCTSKPDMLQSCRTGQHLWHLPKAIRNAAQPQQRSTTAALESFG